MGEASIAQLARDDGTPESGPSDDPPDALRQAVAIDPRITDVPSTKGAL